MTDPWKNILLAAKPQNTDPTPGIMTRISQEKAARALKRRFFAYSALSLVSAAVFVVSLFAAGDAFARSGFSSFLSLLWTDFSAVASLWRSYLATLVEALPTASSIIVLASVFTLISFLRMAAKNFSAARPYIHHKTA